MTKKLTNIYFRRRVGGSDLALYIESNVGEDHRCLPYTGKFRKSRKIYDAHCGHKIQCGSLYFDARSSSLPGTAVRYCKDCLSRAENAEWDFEDGLVEHEEVMDSLSDDDMSCN